MIEWWGLFHNALWVVGLACCLAALGLAGYRAWEAGLCFRRAAALPGLRLALNAGLALFCLGLLLGGGPWWEQAAWGGLALAFVAEGAWSGLRVGRGPVVAGPAAPAERPVRAAGSLRRGAARLAAAEVPVVGLAVAAGVVTARALPWALPVAAAFWALRWVAHGRPGVRTPADWGIVLLLLMVPVTLWATALPEVTRPQVYRLLGGVALYYALANWPPGAGRRRWLVGGALLAGLALAAYALVSVEWITGKLPFLPAGLYERLPALGADRIHANVAAGSLVLLLPLPLAWLLFVPPRQGRALWMLAWLAAAAVGAVLLATQSRGALLALPAAGAGLVLLRWRRGWLLVGALAAAGLLAAWRLGLPDLGGVMAGGGAATSVEGRLEVWSRALYMIQDFALTGVGLGTFGPVADSLYPFFTQAAGAVTHAHNLYLQVAVDLGLPGLVAWLSILLATAAAAWLAYHRGRQAGDPAAAALGAGLLAGQLALAVHGLADATTWGEIRTAPLVWALWGLAAAALCSTKAGPAAQATGNAAGVSPIPAGENSETGGNE